MGWGGRPRTQPTNAPKELVEAAEVMSKSRVKRLEATAPGLVPRCSDCGEAQFQTPSGMVCKNGHGGAEPAEVNEPPTANAKAQVEWHQLKSRKGWVDATLLMLFYEFIQERGLFADLVKFARRR